MSCLSCPVCPVHFRIFRATGHVFMDFTDKQDNNIFNFIMHYIKHNKMRVCAFMYNMCIYHTLWGVGRESQT